MQRNRTSGWELFCSFQRSALMLFLSLLCVADSGCGKTGVGDPCSQASDCPSGLCLGAAEGFPSGYCSADCSASQCEGEASATSCQPLGESGPVVCLRTCQSVGDCRDGSQCYEGRCQPRCQADADCLSDGYKCDGGACVERPGAKSGESCANDTECSSQACVAGKCVRSCRREAGCGTDETCVLDRTATRVRGLCLSQRPSAPKQALGSCASDGDCQRGSCVMGSCLLMCQHPHDCAAPGAERSCTELPAPLTKLAISKWPLMRTCLPANQNFSVPIHNPIGVQTLLVPATARSVTLVLSAPNNDQTSTVGMSFVNDASGAQLFGLWNPADQGGYFRNPIRHMPNQGSAIFMLSTSPHRIPVRTAPYTLSVFGNTGTGANFAPDVTAIYKLYNQQIAGGRMPLRIHVTDLSGLPSDCSYRSMTAASAPTVLAPMVQKLREIYAQGTVKIEFDPITYIDSQAGTSVDANGATSLGTVLADASKQSGGGLDLVMIRSISPNGILGIAGGIPGAPGLKGNPRTGAVMSIGFLCMPGTGYGLPQLAQTAAHELGHTLGLSHNRESNGQIDPLGDGMSPSESSAQDAANLMYWAATSMPGQTLTAEQGQVIRSMPQVQP